MSHSVTRSITRLSFLLGALFILTTPAAAQDGGLRGGLSVDPDQFYFGGHLETAPLVDRLHFRPNVEIGFGDDLTLIGANMEFVYKFPNRRDWGLYAGGGPALNVYMFDDVDDSETDAGLNLLVGVESSRGLFFEFKLGVIDSPDFKFGVGWTFR
ncbi:MAG: hypothetical protein AB7N29_11080 [Vicinamibacterales bacterium]